MKNIDYLRRGPFFTILYNVESTPTQVAVLQWTRRILLTMVPLAIIGFTIDYTTLHISIFSILAAIGSYIAITFIWDYFLKENRLLVSIPNRNNSPIYCAILLKRKKKQMLNEDIKTILRILWFTNTKGSLSPMTEGIETHIENLIEKASLKYQQKETDTYNTILDVAYNECDTEPITIVAQKDI